LVWKKSFVVVVEPEEDNFSLDESRRDMTYPRRKIPILPPPGGKNIGFQWKTTKS
jgi:hypothetical protein